MATSSVRDRLKKKKAQAPKPKPESQESKPESTEIMFDWVDPDQLKPHPRNAKKHPDKQIDEIVKSMDNTGGSIQPIVVDDEWVVLAGHGRLMAHKRRGDLKVPIVVKSGLSDEQKLKFLLADNQLNAMTGNYDDLVAEIMQDLSKAKVDLGGIGFSEKEVDKMLGYDPNADMDRISDASDVSRTAYELADDLKIIDLSETYEFPMLDADKIPPLEEAYTVWMNRHRTVDSGNDFFHMFGRESTKGLDADRALIGFYIDDKRFERVWSHRRENAQRFVNAGVKALVMPDFTRIDGAPLPENIWQTYRNFYMARYWQDAGLMVIPNVTEWNLDSVPGCCEPIPKNAPSLATQLQTIGGRSMASGGSGAVGVSEDEIRICLDITLELLKPEALLVYGGEPGLRLGKNICKKHSVRFVGVENRATASTSAFDNGDI